MKRIKTLLLLMLFSCKMLAVVWHNVNIDRTTATAMTAAYEVEIAMETMAKDICRIFSITTGQLPLPLPEF